MRGREPSFAGLNAIEELSQPLCLEGSDLFHSAICLNLPWMIARSKDGRHHPPCWPHPRLAHRSDYLARLDGHPMEP
jgi:hypothetical protein